MGNRPKPTALKILQGNPGKRPLNGEEPQPSRGIPKMPKWLKSFSTAVKEWKRESKELDDMGVMTTAECGDLAQRSYIAHKIQKLAMDVETEGDTIEVKQMDKDGVVVVLNVKTNPKVVQLKALLSEYRQYGSLLGLDPSSRSKLKTDRPKQQSRAESFRSRKNG